MTNYSIYVNGNLFSKALSAKVSYDLIDEDGWDFIKYNIRDSNEKSFKDFVEKYFREDKINNKWILKSPDLLEQNLKRMENILLDADIKDHQGLNGSLPYYAINEEDYWFVARNLGEWDGSFQELIEQFFEEDKEIGRWKLKPSKEISRHFTITPLC